ncbi:MAG: Actin-like protein arp9 (SWI/SNF complex component arp9) [Caeruleum heppii]|nr:MAG: Actin-like protein arp9 (SWI/SNF complex component arp9) [Caeruleum heppii]
MPPFKDEHILIIAPGSQNTLAQLGLPESFAPARLRLPTRMFPAERKGEWEPFKVRRKKVVKPVLQKADTINGDDKNVETEKGQKEDDHKPGDVAMVAADRPEATPTKADISAKDAEETDGELEEDWNTDEGAVYPLQQGRVTNWSCFLALLNHIHNTISPPFHTPILVVAQPAWTAEDHETVTQFFFEKFKTPAFCLIDSSLAVCYAYGIPTATVIDVGYEKADVTAISDFISNEIGRGIAVPKCGGQAMTDRLYSLLQSKGWTRDMCEQLKKSSICEILPKDVPLPKAEKVEPPKAANPAAAASTGASASGPEHRDDAAVAGTMPRGPGVDTEAGVEEADGDLKGLEDDEGVLDVATIVATGKTQEFLARKEREKAERAAAKKAASDAAGVVKTTKLPNSRREKNVFFYEGRAEGINEHGKRTAESDTALDGGESKRQKTPEAEQGDGASAAVETTLGDANGASDPVEVVRREMEVGLERFMAASGGIIDDLADAVHRTVLAVGEVGKRSELWDSLVIVGNGSRVKGFKEALLSTLSARYLISPSSATIFTSELPSDLSTPVATGANTPQLQPQSSISSTSYLSPHGPPGVSSSGVNPLLVAATTASASASTPSHPHPSSSSNNPSGTTSHRHSSHSQTPTSLRLARQPDYFPEFKDVGFEDAAFLGAQVAAKVIFVVDQGVNCKGFLTRGEYNEVGPGGVHGVAL